MHNHFVSDYRKLAVRPSEVGFPEIAGGDEEGDVTSLLLEQPDEFLKWWANPEGALINRMLGEQIQAATIAKGAVGTGQRGGLEGRRENPTMSEMKHGHEHTADDDIGCLETIEWIYAWLDGEIENPETAARVEEHIEHCLSCWSRSEMERALTARIRENPNKKAPRALQDRLRKLLQID